MFWARNGNTNNLKKSCILETENLPTNKDSSSDTKKNPDSKAKLAGKKTGLHCNFTLFMRKNFPKDSKNLKSLDIGLWEVGAKRH